MSTDLKNDPTIQFFANIDDDLYDLVSKTNPLLKRCVDTCRLIMAEGEGGSE